MLDGLKVHMDRAGFEVYNCTPGSHLWTFPHKEFAEAIAEATDSFEQELQTHGWYGSD